MKTIGERLSYKAIILLVLAALPLGCREKPRFDYDFEQPALLDELEWKCGTFFRLSSDHATSGSSSLEVTFYPGPQAGDESYPGLFLSDFDPDWSGYQSLVFDAFIPGEKAIRLSVRIDDRENPDYADRFNAGISLTPGSNHIAIPLTSLITSGSKRRLNLENVRDVTFFLVSPEERYAIFFDRVRVEK